eukprot:2947030-Ditylum_brightwellii.AAC.1
MGQQPTEMSGIGTDHQNAMAEKAIGTVVRSARTMLLHTAIYWPEETNLMIWPFVLDYAVDLWNRTPDVKSRISPLDKFSATFSDHTDLLIFHM